MERGAKVDEAPDVDLVYFYVEAFSELSTCRISGFGLSPIPFTAIVEYAKIYEVDDFEEFLYLIRVMDNTLINIKEKQKKTDNGVKGRKSSTN